MQSHSDFLDSRFEPKKKIVSHITCKQLRQLRHLLGLSCFMTIYLDHRQALLSSLINTFVKIKKNQFSWMQRHFFIGRCKGIYNDNFLFCIFQIYMHACMYVYVSFHASSSTYPYSFSLGPGYIVFHFIFKKKYTSHQVIGLNCLSEGSLTKLEPVVDFQSIAINLNLICFCNIVGA